MTTVRARWFSSQRLLTILKPWKMGRLVVSQLPGVYCSSYTSCPSGFSVTITALCCVNLACAALRCPSLSFLVLSVDHMTFRLGKSHFLSQCNKMKKILSFYRTVKNNFQKLHRAYDQQNFPLSTCYCSRKGNKSWFHVHWPVQVFLCQMQLHSAC